MYPFRIYKIVRFAKQKKVKTTVSVLNVETSQTYLKLSKRGQSGSIQPYIVLRFIGQTLIVSNGDKL